MASEGMNMAEGRIKMTTEPVEAPGVLGQLDVVSHEIGRLSEILKMLEDKLTPLRVDEAEAGSDSKSGEDKYRGNSQVFDRLATQASQITNIGERVGALIRTVQL